MVQHSLVIVVGDAHNTQFARSKTVGVRRTEPEATIRLYDIYIKRFVRLRHSQLWMMALVGNRKVASKSLKDHCKPIRLKSVHLKVILLVNIVQRDSERAAQFSAMTVAPRKASSL